MLDLTDTTVQAAIISAAVALISAAIALTIGILSYLHNKAKLKEEKRREKRKDIYKKLDEFYGPLESYLNMSNILFRMFVKGKPNNFRTLTYLLQPEQEYDTEGGKVRVVLSETDKMLLKEILAVGEKIEDLVVTKSGLVDDDELRYNYIPDPEETDVELAGFGLLSVLQAHLRVIRLAHDGFIHGEVDRFKNYVYPRELNKKIDLRIRALQAELVKLNT